MARINETLWSELFLENREPLTAELDTLIENLTAIRNQISGGNQEKLKALLCGKDGKSRRRLENENPSGENRNPL